MELREWHPEMSELGAELCAHTLLRSASGSHRDHTRSTTAPRRCTVGCRHPGEGTVLLSKSIPKLAK